MALINSLYIVAFALFIYGLMQMRGPRTAVAGNWVAAAGMGLAVVATLLIEGMGNWLLIGLGIAIGTVISIPAAYRVKMTAMPQMVALFNGLGGGAIALISWAQFRDTAGYAHEPVHAVIASLFAALVGSISFWGSLVAYAKLQELLPGKPLTLGRAQQPVNLALIVAAIAAAVVITTGGAAGWWMIALLAAAALIGLIVVLPIGGADMPVVISLLNALTGLSAAAKGIALDNTALIVAGMIVGASGSILTSLMAQAMNRSIPAIIAGGFGGTTTTSSSSGGSDRPIRSTSAADTAIQLAYASKVVVVPGYGMAVAQAQHAVKEIATLLETKNIDITFAIHPVAGRMPGHMNVLLAEAD
ncbi:NAD(P)(+) transhydrogenase (Re/Si-specific) subunit beta, partial [Haloechinothrix sp. YIM 98757]